MNKSFEMIERALNCTTLEPHAAREQARKELTAARKLLAAAKDNFCGNDVALEDAIRACEPKP